MTAPLRLGLAALAASILAAAPMISLFNGWGWAAPALVVIAVSSLTGIALRQVTTSWPIVALTQLLLLTLAMTALFAGREALFHLLPGPAVVTTWRHLISEGGQTISQSAPPVPVATGVVMLTTLGLAVVAFLTDLIAASLQRPAVAGLPLLALYCLPAAVLPHGVPWAAFVAAAAGFLILVSVDWVDRVHAWGRILGSGGGDGRQVPLGGPLTGGRRVAAVALVAAVLLPMITPGIQDRLLTGGDGNGRGRGEIHVINPILTLRRDLVTPGNTPVINYRTTVDTPDPLRIASDDKFDGAVWAPSTGAISRRQKVQDGLPTAPGLADGTARTQQTTSIAIGALSETYLPLPYPPTKVQIDGSWLYESRNLNVVGDGQTTTNISYVATHLSVEPTSDQLEQAAEAPADVRSTYTALPAKLPTKISSIAAEVVKGTSNHYEQALKLQDYFRHSGHFTYDLKAPTATSDSGTDAVLEFLTQRHGYCVQFASAMAVMARTLGIPSRVGVGFLPGTKQSDGSYQITLQDAHAWPELYFEGAGWVRFEPTPATRVPSVPSYARTASEPQPQTEVAATPSDSVEPSDAGASTAARPSASAKPQDENQQQATSSTSWWQRIPWRLFGLLALLLVVAGLPALTTLIVRRRRWASAHSAQARAEAAWDDLRDRLGDLGVAWARWWTPRALRHRLIADHELTGAPVEALDRLVSDVENARYAPPDSASARDVEAVRADVDTVVETIATGVSPATRRRARLMPRSGLETITLRRRREGNESVHQLVLDDPNQPKLQPRSTKRRLGRGEGADRSSTGRSRESSGTR